MPEEVLHHRGRTLVRRLHLAPGEATRWHVDLCSRVTVVLQGTRLSIEFRDGTPSEEVEVTPGQTGWDEPFPQPHRAVNTGDTDYTEVSVFFLDGDDVEPQPTAA